MGGGTTGITDAHGSTHTASTSTTTGASFMLAISNTMAHHVRDCGEELHLSCVYGGLGVNFSMQVGEGVSTQGSEE